MNPVRIFTIASSKEKNIWKNVDRIMRSLRFSFSALLNYYVNTIWHLWLLSNAIVEMVLTTPSQGVRQRNSSLPLRDIGAERSKSKSTALTHRSASRNLTASNFDDNSATDQHCHYCNIHKCIMNNEYRTTKEQVFCIATKSDNYWPVKESCVNEHGFHKLLLRETDLTEGCDNNQDGQEFCWCRHVNYDDDEAVVNDEQKLDVVSINSRLWKVKNALHIRASRFNQPLSAQMSSSCAHFNITWISVILCVAFKMFASL